MGDLNSYLMEVLEEKIDKYGSQELTTQRLLNILREAEKKQAETEENIQRDFDNSNV